MDIKSEEIGRKNLMKESCICVCVLERKRSHKHHEDRERGGGENKKRTCK